MIGKRASKVFAASVAALAVAGSMLTTSYMPPPQAHADGVISGGQASGGGVQGNPSPQYARAYVFDNNDTRPQGTYNNSTEYFLNKIQTLTRSTWTPNARNSMRQACNEAFDRLGDRKFEARVVAMGWFSNGNRNPLSYGGVTTESDKRLVANLVRDSLGNLDWRAEAEQRYSKNNVAEKANELTAGDNPRNNLWRSMCIVLAGDQPPQTPPEYRFDASTTAMVNGEAANNKEYAYQDIRSVKDILHARSQSGHNENVLAKVTLHGPLGRFAVKENITIQTNGDTESPEFTPADFGSVYWPLGDYWFDWYVPKQGKMANAWDSPDGLPNESFRVRFRIDGSTKAYFGETLSKNKNFINTNTSVYDELMLNGGFNQIINGTVTLNSARGKTATKDVRGIRAQGKTLSPKFTPSDFGSDKWVEDHYWFTWNIKKQGNMIGDFNLIEDIPDESFNIKYPPADKVWLRDTDNALEVQDPQHTNTKGADKKVFLPGSKVNAVVNTTVPAHVSGGVDGLKTFSIIDDYSGSADWVTFTKENTRIYRNGEDVTSNFAITQQDSVITARANSDYIESIREQPAEMKFKMVLEGTVKDIPVEDYHTFNGSGELTNNAKSCFDSYCSITNTPFIKVDVPRHDKVWVKNSDEALKSNDPGWTNDIALDNSTLTVGQKVGAVVNTTIPGNSNPSTLVIKDDTENVKDLISFTNADATARVFVDGNDFTDRFTITKSGTVVTATLKDQHLDMVQDNPDPIQIKLYLEGIVRKNIDRDMQDKTFDITNRMSVKYLKTGKDIPGNDPVVHVYVPPTDKVWTSNSDQAYIASDTGWTNNEGADNKVFLPGDKIYASVNGYVAAGIRDGLESFTLTDKWEGASKWFQLDKASVLNKATGNDISDQFTIETNGTTTKATAKQEFLDSTKGLQERLDVTLVLAGHIKDGELNGTSTETLSNDGGMTIDHSGEFEYNKPEVNVGLMRPNKVWGKNHEDALVNDDPEWTNQKGIDTKSIQPGDEVNVVVNAVIPAGLAEDMTHLALADDWTRSARWVNFAKGTAKVFRDGQDVTDKFVIETDGTVTKATAKPEFLENTKDLPEDSKLKLSLTAKTRGEVKRSEVNRTFVLPNGGFYEFNNSDLNTNEPWIDLNTQNVGKEVVASESNDGLEDNIDGRKVFPGQWLKYNVDMDVTVNKNYVYDIETLKLIDNYDDKFVADQSTLSILDTRSGTTIERSNYNVEWDLGDTSFTVTFKPEWIKANIGKDKPGVLRVMFEGKVKDDFKGIVVNEATQIFNKSELPSPKPQNPDVEISTKKQITDLEGKIDLNGKWFLPGDKFTYRYDLDAGPARDELGYDVHRLGAVDDYDELVLIPDVDNIKVLDGTTDVTDKFYVREVNGVIYTFAKFVERENTLGKTIKAEEPTDWAAYSAKDMVDPLTDAVIDQALLGKKYTVVVPAQVRPNLKDVVEFENQAYSLLENQVVVTNKVNNKVNTPNPHKDVVQEIGGESINEGEVEYLDDFYYELKSTDLEANYGNKVTNWTAVDDFDESKDRPNGEFKVVRYSGDEQKDITEVLKIQFLDENNEPLCENGADNYNYDDCFAKAKSFKVSMQKGGLDDLNAWMETGDGVVNWKVFVGFDRVAKDVTSENGYTEGINEYNTKSNIVRTHTPNTAPVKDVVQEVGGKSINEGEVKLHDDFFYKLTTTRVPGELRNQKLTNWSIFDNFDDKDELGKEFRVITETKVGDFEPGSDVTQYFELVGYDKNGDLAKYDDGTTPEAAPATAEPMGTPEANVDSGSFIKNVFSNVKNFFTGVDDTKDIPESTPEVETTSKPVVATQAPRPFSNAVSFEVKAKPEFLEMINQRGENPEQMFQWTAYVKMHRHVVSDKIDNEAIQRVNEFSDNTNTVWTHTPNETPEKDVVQTIEGESINSEEVPMHDDFYYKLTTPYVPNQVNEKRLDRWSIVDNFDDRDFLNGEFKVFTDVAIGDVYKPGDDVTNLFKLVGYNSNNEEVKVKAPTQSTPEGASPGGPFDYGTPLPDPNRPVKFEVRATDKFLDLIYEQGEANELYKWTVYVKMDRHTAGERFENIATQFVNNWTQNTNRVWTHTPRNTPVKDVVQTIEGPSIDEGEVPMGDDFFYKLETTKSPNEINGDIIRRWSIFDDFDDRDKVTGTFKVVSNTEINDNIPEGADITEYFELKYINEDSRYTDRREDAKAFEVLAKPEFLKMINLKGETQEYYGWTAYVEMVRNSPTDKLENTAIQYLNEYEDITNTVWTHTPVDVPHKDVVSEIGSESINDETVKFNSDIYYKLTTHKTLAGGGVENWLIKDDFDERYDTLNGNFKVELDLPVGEIEAGADVTSMFELVPTDDNYNRVATKEATRFVVLAKDEFKDAINALEDSEDAFQWTAYVGVKRTGAGSIPNSFIEIYNDYDPESNQVVTHTPPVHNPNTGVDNWTVWLVAGGSLLLLVLGSGAYVLALRKKQENDSSRVK